MPFALEARDLRSDRSQRRDELFHRPLAQPRRSVETEPSRAPPRQRRQEPRRRPGLSGVERDLARRIAAERTAPAQSPRGRPAPRSHRRSGTQEHRRVAALERPRDLDRTEDSAARISARLVALFDARRAHLAPDLAGSGKNEVVHEKRAPSGADEARLSVVADLHPALLVHEGGKDLDAPRADLLRPGLVEMAEEERRPLPPRSGCCAKARIVSTGRRVLCLKLER